MRHILTTISLCFLPLCAFALPAWQGPLVRTTADGTEKVVYLHGDQHFHYLTDAEGQWYDIDGHGILQPQEALTDEELSLARLRSPMLQTSQKRIGQLNIAPRGLVIMVNFQDCSFLAANDRAAFDDMHNSDNYTYNGATGSARQYFIAQSHGLYQPHFDVVGPVTVAHEISYYGQNRRGQDARPEEMVIEACQLVKEQYPDIDFRQYDNDHDGFVDFVYIIYAGYNEANGADPSTIWPHNYYVYSGTKHITCKIDGVQIDNYACSSELQGTRGSVRAGVGTFCHEFSHVLGLPDLYTTNNASHKTLGQWDILDYGPYNNDGRTPPSYSAYERFYMGWLEPIVLTSRANLKLENLNSSNMAYLISPTEDHNLDGVNPDPQDFYLLENRQKTGWDRYLPGHGLMITHIRYSSQRWQQNIVNNNAATMGVDIVEADEYAPTADEDANSYLGKQGDLFPDEWRDSVTLIAGQALTNIRETEDGLITMLYKGGKSPIIDSLYNDPTYKPEILGYYTPNGSLTGAEDLNDLTQGLYIIRVSKDPEHNKRGKGKKVLIVK